MSLTKITWEEFDTFEKIESPKGYDFRTHEGKYYTFGEFGVASVRRIFEINPSDFNEYLLGRRTAREIDFKAENDRWPPTEEERRESRRKFISKHPASLIDVPKNRKLFSKEELEELIPIAEKLWIESEGELPDYYVSPLK
ncbi:hypothetical protein HMPREF0491_03022 [Lachnospiraceae oral taxon 107 str. F0167]|jgi:hypothetical protein|uniref:Uncharacterized protein n=2 Tax=Lachnoanaerobaculum saburreum TaxID=467210 RepID=I0RAX0_9FIRM|nr:MULTISPECIES: hypothetical protein [Lachnoanaerobaculum]EFU75932.1 hypothetical protein HMPREF0381_2186 [Lachnoanaerobaculum saburreum DSM 3986]EGG88673.1 hypothetical protein HMPREF0491_03022 [Lachnospiraceae oral taxon 107 str. F0167]EIC96828.1 hypothetical protein HMPREF9970_0183 [Lachnoanaerobaculum saburreum F0468]MBO1871356.1 hypothetical protein [Lachnoanaerobaculum sp. Marseille-Q4761]